MEKLNTDLCQLDPYFYYMEMNKIPANQGKVFN